MKGGRILPSLFADFTDDPLQQKNAASDGNDLHQRYQNRGGDQRRNLILRHRDIDGKNVLFDPSEQDVRQREEEYDNSPGFFLLFLTAHGIISLRAAFRLVYNA